VAKVKQGSPQKKRQKKLTFVDFQGVFAWKSFKSRFPPPNKAPTKQNISLCLVLCGVVTKAAPLLVVRFHPNQLCFCFLLM
jgi:hypothetical protein